MKLYLYGYDFHAVTQKLTSHNLLYSELFDDIIALPPNAGLPNALLCDPDAILMLLQDSLEKGGLWPILCELIKRDRTERCTVCWSPFDRYTSILFHAFKKSGVISNACDRVCRLMPPDELAHLYYYNKRYGLWILEPQSLALNQMGVDSVISSLSHLPFDAVLCQSSQMADDLNAAGHSTTYIHYPSTTNGTRYFPGLSINMLAKNLCCLYDGSLPLLELVDDSSFLELFDVIDKAGGYIQISSWQDKRLYSKFLNGLISIRRGAINRCKNPDQITFEQRWGGGTKLNVAARCGVPLLGFWQDSFTNSPSRYPFLEIGTDDFDEYLKYSSARELVIAKCVELRNNLLRKATPHKWLEETEAFLLGIMPQYL